MFLAGMDVKVKMSKLATSDRLLYKFHKITGRSRGQINGVYYMKNGELDYVSIKFKSGFNDRNYYLDVFEDQIEAGILTIIPKKKKQNHPLTKIFK